MQSLSSFALLMALLPLLGAVIAGLCGHYLGRNLTHRLIIAFIGIAFLISLYLFNAIVINREPIEDHLFYIWGTAGVFQFDVGFLLDPLSATISTIVLFVSLMVHVYTIGYMADDEGYQRFFSYVSLFTFSMLILVNMVEKFIKIHSGRVNLYFTQMFH